METSDNEHVSQRSTRSVCRNGTLAARFGRKKTILATATTGFL
ncbi:hypothetical protein MuYL_4774 [Mucilaginibacter xinganensis]|uniref:Uncharacterized protein n=1 Tax=Mucilaginibacter xinganensis TaxID=1234841 RepID=A0A223P3H0_9SPHI|nr:hypothetical protein MuYL_4774 [Mucilaginibacter xinganensis]